MPGMRFRSWDDSMKRSSPRGTPRDALRIRRLHISTSARFSGPRATTPRLSTHCVEQSICTLHSPDAAVVLADVLESTGRFAEAEAELQRALRIRPDYAGAAFKLGQLYWNGM